MPFPYRSRPSCTSRVKKNKSDFFRVTCWQQDSRNCEPLFCKGKPILVEGRIQNDNYTDNNGGKALSDQIIADRLLILYSLTRPEMATMPVAITITVVTVTVAVIIIRVIHNGYQNNNYNNGGYNNGGYNNNGYNNGGYQNQPNYNNAPPQQFAPPVQQSQPKDVQLGNDSGKSDDFNDFEEIISDGALPF